MESAMGVRTRTLRVIHNDGSDLYLPMGSVKLFDKKYGTVEWLLDRALHRLDGPARIWNDGCEEWCVYGYYHREDGPALIDPTAGLSSWFIDRWPVASYGELQEKLECSDEHIVALKLRWGAMRD
jgi:hypothetical protein